MKKLLLSLVLLISFIHASSTIKVLGTSTLHDWEIDVTKMMVKKEGGKLKAITLKVKDMISTEGSSMDDNTFEAMNEPKYPKINFKVTSIGSKFIKGKLTIHGVTKNITTKYSLVKGKITGKFKLVMSKYGVKPPEFMFGAMKTGDEVEIVFSI